MKGTNRSADHSQHYQLFHPWCISDTNGMEWDSTAYRSAWLNTSFSTVVSSSPGRHEDETTVASQPCASELPTIFVDIPLTQDTSSVAQVAQTWSESRSLPGVRSGAGLGWAEQLRSVGRCVNVEGD